MKIDLRKYKIVRFWEHIIDNNTVLGEIIVVGVAGIIVLAIIASIIGACIALNSGSYLIALLLISPYIFLLIRRVYKEWNKFE